MNNLMQYIKANVEWRP